METEFIRDSDGKAFRAVGFGHWTEIQAADGENDHVKWFGRGFLGAEKYVGATSGHTYLKVTT